MDIDDQPYRILLVEDDLEDARLVRRQLQASRLARFEVVHETRLGAAAQTATKSLFDLVLLDLNLPDCTGLETVDYFTATWSSGPIVVLTGLDDDLTGFDAVRHGAQDYLTKDAIPTPLLERTIRYAIERYKYSFDLNAERRTTSEALLEFSASLRKPMSELLTVASDLCQTLMVHQPREADRIEQLKSAASRLVAAINRPARGVAYDPSDGNARDARVMPEVFVGEMTE